MPTIEPHISKYIDSSIDKAVKIAGKEFSERNKAYLEESKNHMSAVIEEFKGSLKAFKELVPSIPTEGRIREIVHEEIKPLHSDIKLCVNEIGKINKKLDNHERRITRLEVLQPA